MVQDKVLQAMLVNVNKLEEMIKRLSFIMKEIKYEIR